MAKKLSGKTASARPGPEINYPLVEAKRPAMYRAMKYWGKKPHNIWSEYIEHYAPVGGVVVDPFAGSAVAAFEAVKLGRKAVAFDLNPLTSFIIEVTASAVDFDKKIFTRAASEIISAVEGSAEYKLHFLRTRDSKTATVLNYRWDDGKVSAAGVQYSDKTRQLAVADKKDVLLGRQQSAMPISTWFPAGKFPKHPSITHKFLTDIGGSTVDCLWTRRNLFLLSAIFAKILLITDKSLKLQLLSAFTQTVHLCTKMVVPRNKASNRDYSGSWGRPDYMVRRRQMEQNPVDVFRRSCMTRQGVLPMMQDAAKTFPDGLDIHDVRTTKKLKPSADINYGAVDVADLHDYLNPASADFVITDPPYAGLVRYLPLTARLDIPFRGRRVKLTPRAISASGVWFGEQGGFAYGDGETQAAARIAVHHGRLPAAVGGPSLLSEAELALGRGPIRPLDRAPLPALL